MARKAALGHRTGAEAAGFSGERVSHLPVCSERSSQPAAARREAGELHPPTNSLSGKKEMLIPPPLAGEERGHGSQR